MFDVLGEKQHVAFDDLAKLHQLGLVKSHFLCSMVFLTEGISDDFMGKALDAGSSGLGSSPGRGQCDVFLNKTFYSQTLYSHRASCAPFHPTV